MIIVFFYKLCKYLIITGKLIILKWQHQYFSLRVRTLS